jgi:hypothetical protein
MGLPTLLQREGDEATLKTGDTIEGKRGDPCCRNEAEAPILIPEFGASKGSNPKWYPVGGQLDKLHYGVPLELNVRQIGDITEPVEFYLEGGAGFRPPLCTSSSDVEGSLVYITPGPNTDEIIARGDTDPARDDPLFRFDPSDHPTGNVTEQYLLIFESNNVCGIKATDTILDNVGELSLTARFEDGGRWEGITGSATHSSSVRYYTPGQSEIVKIGDAVQKAMQKWATETIGAVFPLGPVRMYRVARVISGLRPAAGPATTYLGIWDGVSGLTDLPLTPSEVLEQTVVAGVTSGATPVEDNEIKRFFPGVRTDTDVGVHGPTLYFSDTPDDPPDTPSKVLYDESFESGVGGVVEMEGRISHGTVGNGSDRSLRIKGSYTDSDGETASNPRVVKAQLPGTYPGGIEITYDVRLDTEDQYAGLHFVLDGYKLKHSGQSGRIVLVPPPGETLPSMDPGEEIGSALPSIPFLSPSSFETGAWYSGTIRLTASGMEWKLKKDGDVKATLESDVNLTEPDLIYIHGYVPSNGDSVYLDNLTIRTVGGATGD